jgi:hypothetical protein
MNYKVLNDKPKVGDVVMVIMYTHSIEEPFEVITGTLTRLDEEPSGSINNEEVYFASEGHTSKIFKIKEWDEDHALDMVINNLLSDDDENNNP